MFRFRVLPLMALSSLIAAACAPLEAPGLVMVAVSSNLVPGQDWQQGYLVVSDLTKGNTASYTAQFSPRDTNLPFTLAFRADEPDDNGKYTARLRIVLANADPNRPNGNPDIGGGGVVALRDLQFELPGPQQQQMIRISMDWLSMSDTAQTLGAYNNPTNLDAFPPTNDANCSSTLDATGNCVPLQATSDSPFDRKIEPYDPALIFGGGDSPDNGSCYPASDCFAGATPVTAVLVGESCQVDVGAAVGDSTSLAVLTASTDSAEIKRCGPLGCGDDLGAGVGRGVVLDRELLEVSDSLVKLPKLVCTRFPAGAKVLVSNRCSKKDRALPLCPVQSRPGRINTIPITPT